MNVYFVAEIRDCLKSCDYISGNVGDGHILDLGYV